MTDPELISALSEPQFPPELWSAVDTLAETVLRISDERHALAQDILDMFQKHFGEPWINPIAPPDPPS